MPKVLFNPTNEELRTQYVGEEVIIPAGAKIRVDDPRGRQVLNVLFPRGLCELEYGDEGDAELKKAETGRERNRAFKRKQVMDFNALNDQRHQAKLPYLVPAPHVKSYANELGMKLFEPYSSSDEAKREGMELRAELQKKDDQLSEMRRANEAMQAEMTQMRQLMQKVLAGQAPQAETSKAQPPDSWEDLRRQVRGINRTHFSNWVSRNFDAIKEYPEDIQAEIHDKYERMYGMKYPETAVEAGAQAA